MPNFEYICEICNYKFEAFHSMLKRLKKCPQCGQDSLIRLIGKGGGIIFKGKGFYENDYKKIDDAIKENNKMNKEREERTKEDSEF